ncbi:hypothetical protein IJ579_09235 [bacterium]|nr:hypothetical protein [bacterium]
MRTPGVKLGFSIADYAKLHGMGIGSFRLKDGSSIKILQNPEKEIVEFFHVKAGKLFDGSFYKGEGCIESVAANLTRYEGLAESVEELNKAWAQSMYPSAF